MQALGERPLSEEWQLLAVFQRLSNITTVLDNNEPFDDTSRAAFCSGGK